ncbi:SGNH/GDSL hydrolase family protein [Vibrio sp. AH4]|uniref:SGNH/GDSL hydrolase family protein n=1 Tax=Vibrio sp. AH4 TaxID=2919577 RepID=UPI0027384282|nr:SGNH/GDSL hydrolase family protein [Vibrio sp. AH4]MDP4493635.1 SGNH/GDSL hydrolase family protein [Vibrio sp. AH4]
MKTALFTLIAGLTSLSASAATEPWTKTEMPLMSRAQVEQVQGKQTYTYVRCWYRPAATHDDPYTTWEWAKNKNGSDYTINGYWWSSISHKNMFYTDVQPDTIKQRCYETLGVTHETADVTYFAADTRLSYNHTIWSNDSSAQPHKINKVIVFGDSLSDTGNIFNASQWRFPNPSSWFLGHFSNGFVWTEYLAQGLNIPIYNWAVGGAAGRSQYIALTGVYEQVSSYLTYMQLAKHYQPENSLFTLEFGLNDFMNYNRSLADVKADYSSALIRLVDAGAENIVLLTLPDATRAPQFQYSTQEQIETVRSKIKGMNAFIREQARYYQMQGIRIALFDAYALFESMTSDPQYHGFVNASSPCLDIRRSSAADYLLTHSLSAECAAQGSDRFVFWEVTHPTTATHRYIAQLILATQMAAFPL